MPAASDITNMDFSVIRRIVAFFNFSFKSIRLYDFTAEEIKIIENGVK